MAERVNWKLALPLTVGGVALFFWGLALGDFTRATWADALIHVGSIIGLLAVLASLERRLLKTFTETAKTVAADTAERTTADLRDRIVRLEDLDEAQVRERERRRLRDESAVERLKGEAITAETVGDLVVAGQTESLFYGEKFRLRTSTDPNSHVLYMIPLKAQNGVQALWLDFEPFVYDERTLDVAGSPIHAPLKGASTVMWILKDQTAAQIASDLEEGLERRNEPLNDFRLGYALARLAESIKVMRAARAAEAGSPRRMKGSLQMLINDSWAITSYGLESVMHANAYQANWAGFGSTGRFGPTTVNVPTSVADGGLLQWGEALSWLEDRERWRVDRGPGPS